MSDKSNALDFEKTYKFNKKLKFSITIIINLICLFFVVWKCTECIILYLKNPQGTKLSMEYTAKQRLFPSVTICTGDPQTITAWNEEKIKSCGIDGYFDKFYYVQNYFSINKTINANCFHQSILVFLLSLQF